MHVLILGGTRFIGPHIVHALHARGHHTTLVNRGKTTAPALPQVETIVADRDGGLEVLRGRRWDAVIDTCGYTPRVVTHSAELLRESVDRYLFVSTISVYADPSQPLAESSGLHAPPAEAVEQVTGETYGPLKVACEQVLEQYFGERATLVRPGLIVGPYDYTDRFTYWPVRCAAGGDVLAPLPAAAPVQVIDARDLAAWMVTLLEEDRGGVMNAVGPSEATSLGDFLSTCIDATREMRAERAAPDAVVRWASGAFLAEHAVELWRDLPLCVPEDARGMQQVANGRALEAGLALRPLRDTVLDTLAWRWPLLDGHPLQAGLTRERELAVLDAWTAS